MRKQLTEEEEQFRNSHVFKIKKPNHSQPRPIQGKYNKCTILHDPENAEKCFWAFQHPLRSYKKFVRKHCLNDFERIRIMTGDNVEAFERKLKKIRPHRQMRVRTE